MCSQGHHFQHGIYRAVIEIMVPEYSNDGHLRRNCLLQVLPYDVNVAGNVSSGYTDISVGYRNCALAGS
jgi:hypothetical protein